MVSFRLGLSSVFTTVVLATCSFPLLAQRSDPVAVANDEAAFNRERAAEKQRVKAQDASRRPVQVAKRAHFQDGPCKIKPVMTDAEIDVCRTVKR